MNENHVLQYLGLSETTEGDLEKIFSEELNLFLKSHKFIESKKEENTENVQILK